MPLDLLLLINLIILFLYMSICFVLGKHWKRIDVVDTAWGGGFIVVAALDLLARQNIRTEIIGTLVLVWGVRLAIHISFRSKKKGPDPRYVELSSKWNQKRLWLRAYFSIYLTQAFIIFVISLPVAVSAHETTHLSRWLAFTGLILWLIGFLFESIADKQLRDFISSESNKGKVLQTGLWRYSRHPNYFGELLQWWSIGLLALGSPIGFLGLLGPLTLTFLILFISGIPTIEKRRLTNPVYQEYKSRTSVLFPLPNKANKLAL